MGHGNGDELGFDDVAWARAMRRLAIGLGAGRHGVPLLLIRRGSLRDKPKRPVGIDTDSSMESGAATG